MYSKSTCSWNLPLINSDELLMKLHVQRTLYNDNRFSVFISDNETRGNIIYFFRIWTFLEKSPILQHGERGPELRGKLFPLFLPNDIRGHIANAKSVPSHGSSHCSGRSALWVGPHILCLNKVYMNVSVNSN